MLQVRNSLSSFLKTIMSSFRYMIYSWTYYSTLVVNLKVPFPIFWASSSESTWKDEIWIITYILKFIWENQRSVEPHLKKSWSSRTWTNELQLYEWTCHISCFITAGNLRFTDEKEWQKKSNMILYAYQYR